MKTYKNTIKMVAHGVTAEFSILAGDPTLAKEKLDWFLRVALASPPFLLEDAETGSSVTFNISDHGQNAFADSEELEQHYKEESEKTKQYYVKRNKELGRTI